MNKFAFVIPMRNAHATIGQMLRSLIAQTHDGWRAIIIDDASDATSIVQAEAEIARAAGYLGDDRITLIKNDKRMWEVANVIAGIALCSADEIVCRLDADDWLVDCDVLSIISSCYDADRCDALWTMHRWNFTSMNISAALPDGADPYVHPWVSSHLKTWRASISHSVNPKNYVNDAGELFRRAGDQAIYLPVLKLARRKVFLPLVAYHYSIDMSSSTFRSEDALFQRSEAELIRRRGFIQ